MKNYGQGRIFKQGEWYYIDYSHRGKRHREAVGSRKRSAAVKLLKLRLGESAQGNLRGPVAEKLTLGDLLAMVEGDHQLRECKSKAPTARLLAHFGERFRALDLTHDELTRYAGKRLGESAQPATVRNELAVLGRGFTLAYQAGKLPQRPPLPSIKVRNARSGFFEPADLAAALPHLPAYLRPYVEAGYITGWRRGELVGMTWRQVDWDTGQLRLETGTTKNDEGRVFPFAAHPRLKELLLEQRERVEAIQRERGFLIPWVFVHDDGRQMRGWYYDAWRSACEKAGIPGRFVHDFRRSSVRNLVRAGVPEAVAMKLTGHKTRSIFDRYNITSGTDLEAAVAKLARFHENPGEASGVLRMTGRGRRA